MYPQSLLTPFPTNHFPTNFVGHLEFLHELQKCIYVRYTWRIFDPPGYLQSQIPIFSKIVFFAIFGGHLDFLHKTQKQKKNTLIYETLHFGYSYFTSMEKHIIHRKMFISTKSLIPFGTLCFCCAKPISFSLEKQYSSFGCYCKSVHG